MCANLSGVNLSGADLTNAQITKEQLKETESLKGATMPNGQKYEDWLGTLGAQEDWFRKYTKKLGADKKSKGTNETWEKTAEGKQ
jgi:hypothetical protein